MHNVLQYAYNNIGGDNMNNVVYMYTNKISGRRYVGITNNLERRCKEHLRHSTQLIDKKIKEYGIDNFDFEILCVSLIFFLLSSE